MTVRQWWNGRWGRLVRRDVFVRPIGDDAWQVELRRGGPGGRTRMRSFGSEQSAVEWVERVLLGVDADWREWRAPAEVQEVRRSTSKRASKVAAAGRMAS